MDERSMYVIDDDVAARAALQCTSYDRIETHQLAAPEHALGKGDWPEPDVVPLGDGGVTPIAQPGALE
ncbi:hypothetical protein AS156_35810 [Bradyrhizobium macuxiense]|uniref:Uncharacterized protein n=2 Tax=Bradyrhizobium macuxiense TaxID=1755647 RepID=A0A109JZU1_9BRAD|nr:hypothetical protein AS156_35810 [Bradyrhizobium macuxiense]